jgi:hypothetical protein
VIDEQKFDHRRREKPVFDRLAWHRECYERYLLGLDDEAELDDDDPEEQLLPLPDGAAPFHSRTP